MPTVQSDANVRPVWPTNRPSGAASQTDWPPTALKLPTAQGVAAAAPGFEKLPAGTAPQADWPVSAWNVPASHGVGVAAPLTFT